VSGPSWLKALLIGLGLALGIFIAVMLNSPGWLNPVVAVMLIYELCLYDQAHAFDEHLPLPRVRLVIDAADGTRIMASEGDLCVAGFLDTYLPYDLSPVFLSYLNTVTNLYPIPAGTSLPSANAVCLDTASNVD
jgi:hypothetical protein